MDTEDKTALQEQKIENQGGSAGGGKKVVPPEVLEARRKRKKRRRIFFTVLLAVLLLALAIFLIIHFKLFSRLKKKDPDRMLTEHISAVEYTPKGNYILGSAGNSVIVFDENG
ncbi:MAG: hypothetical protein J5950_08750, partial [Clostridia bacterium]|nr:hypothetical protein [Clostridia bacterium]